MFKTIMNEKCKVPKLIVFDLDYTLWPFYIDSHVTPPFRIHSQCVVDHFNRKVKVYPEVPKVLEYLHSQNVEMGIASRTTETAGAHQLTTLLGWDKYFRYKEIYPGSKIEHFRKFQEYTKYDYSDMLFFDDESRNIVDLQRQNVTSILVENGVTMAVLQQGLEQFSKHFTLWPFYVDFHVVPPFVLTRKGSGIEDSKGTRIKIYPEVNQVLQKVLKTGIPMGIASRTTELHGANNLIELSGWSKYFLIKEIHAGSKVSHFTAIKEKTGIDYTEMLFFDDDMRNIEDVSRMGVVSVLVKNGMTLNDLNKDLTLWNFQVDKCSPPFLFKGSEVTDSKNRILQLFPEVEKLLIYLKSNYDLGIASRITDIQGAYVLLHYFKIIKYFKMVEIYPTNKTLHFNELKRKTLIEFSEMIFFDDKKSNIWDVSKLGVVCHHVADGINYDLVKSLL